ncbi:MAG: hypothetical protein ACKPKO_09010, partial [Candidatus Fonsibacter sp.]
KDNWTGAWATAIGPEQASNPPPTDAKQPRPRFKRGILDETPVADQPADRKPRRRFNTGTLQVTEETPQAPAPQPVRRRLQKPREETPQAPTPKRAQLTTKSTVPHIQPPLGVPQGGAFGAARPKAKAKPRAKSNSDKPESSV